MDLLKKLTSYPALFGWAVIGFIPTLFYFYVGEEGVFALNSIEMWQRQEFMSTVMYGQIGGGGGRPPLYAWLTIPVSLLIGWENVLMASRIVSVVATLGTSLVIAWLAQQLWRKPDVSWVAAILYLTTADVMLYRGWLSYADPLLTLFIVLAIAQIWVASLHKSYGLLALAMVSAFAAFMTKAMTVYVFLGISMLVLLWEAEFRRFLLNKRAWGIYAFAIAMPLLWLKFGTHDAAQHAKMSHDIIGKLVPTDMVAYLIRLGAFPAEMWIRLMPATFFITYFLIRRHSADLMHPAAKLALWMAVLNYLPYLIAPGGSVRYVHPIYAFVTLPAAWLVMQKFHPFNIKKWLIAMLLLGVAFRVFAFPYYQKVYRGESYAQIAREIVERYGDQPLYVTNVASAGLSVAAEIDTLRFGKQPALVWPPADFIDGIVIAHAPDDVEGKLLREIRYNGDTIYLICRGSACVVEQK